MGEHPRRFRVGLSFPGEQRWFVGKVAGELARTLGRDKVLFADYIQPELARLNMDLYLANLYRNETDLLVPFFSADYERKKWTQLEWRQMRDILFNLEEDRIMPFRFDDATVSGLLSIDGYVPVGTLSPSDVAERIVARLESRPPAPSQRWAWWLALIRGAVAPAALSIAYAVVFYAGPPVNPVPGILLLSAIGAASAFAAEWYWRWRPTVGLATGLAVWIVADVLSRIVRPGA